MAIYLVWKLFSALIFIIRLMSSELCCKICQNYFVFGMRRKESKLNKCQSNWCKSFTSRNTYYGKKCRRSKSNFEKYLIIDRKFGSKDKNIYFDLHFQLYPELTDNQRCLNIGMASHHCHPGCHLKSQHLPAGKLLICPDVFPGNYNYKHI